MITHRTLDGSWTACSDPACTLLFHLPDLTPEAAAELPLHLLLPLLEAIDPPYEVDPMGVKVWLHNGHVGRAYDLPAVIRADGTLEWWQDGERAREMPQPAIVYPDGRREWWMEGRQVIATDGVNYILAEKEAEL